ncbi:alpha-tubulin N-acetyltransferase 1 isoform X2 [Denticeps clupeoides]|uniref:Alpha-tubulin N-acetyltransferase 1 n=1 Tax=Denticeps clupeoides TaxID=299321 RepID=A0AAY4DJN5_9TELE|nr:alpha-tubulin N-acetyltransferase 1 isoform X2 [Denticeps clupeoides]
MDFPFDMNPLLPERVSVLDHNLAAARKSFGRPDPQVQISSIIDDLGRASAQAQQLPAPITSAAKLQSNRHQLYLLKDGERNGGRGVAVGFLKVGCKKLFLLDQRGAHVETEPLCVLDFYVTENLQRHGYGLELFNFMLQHKKVEPEMMAYDRPSPKFLAFLEKHYELKGNVPQVNNFVVFDGFFRNRSAAQLRKVPPKKAEGEIKPYSLMEREVVREERKVLPWPFVQPAAPPLSPRLTPSSQFSRSLSVGSSPSRAATAAAPRVQPGQPPHSQLTENCRARRTSHRGLVARGNLYSRHIDSRGVGRLLLEERKGSHKTTGWQPELRESRCDTGRRADSAGHQHTPSFHRFPLAPFSHRGLPPPYRPPPVPRLLLSQRDPKLDPEGAAEGGVGRRAWSWTVGEDRSTAQWVRQKQESRSVWPW